MSDSPRLGFRTAEKVKETLNEIANEQKVSMSVLLNHAVLVLLAGLDRVPTVEWRLEKYVKPKERLNKIIPIVTHWPEHIPEDLIEEVDCRRW